MMNAEERAKTPLNVRCFCEDWDGSPLASPIHIATRTSNVRCSRQAICGLRRLRRRSYLARLQLN